MGWGVEGGVVTPLAVREEQTRVAPTEVRPGGGPGLALPRNSSTG